MIKLREAAAGFLLALSVCFSAGAVKAGQPFLLGAYPGLGSDAEAFEDLIGHTIAIVGYGQTFGLAPRKGVSQDVAAGRVPLVSWTSDNGQGGSVLATDILGGKYDSQLQNQADEYAAIGGTILIEWQPEMTDNPLNALFFAGVAQDQWGSTYVSVWQHIHDIFVSRGATNVKWVWSPGGGAYETNWQGVIPCQAYFPGTAYVDWMGLHSYNKYDTPESYDANLQLLAFYLEAPLWAPGLPLIHSQTGATRATDAQREWIATAETTLQSEFPLIRGLVYFNRDSSHPKPGQTMQYALGGAGLTAFQTMAADPYFNQ